MDYCQLITPGFQDARHTRYLCDLLERVERGEITRIIINAPPGFGKSTLLQDWMSWFIGRDPLRRILLLSASQSLAFRNSRVVRSHIQSAEWPWSTVQLSADSASVEQWNVNAGGALRAVGQGGLVTGFRVEAVVVDDIQADSGSAATRDSLEEWFRGVLTTRLEPNGVVVLIQTRWTQDDIVARLLEGESGDQWMIVNLPALALEDDALGRARGELLWPERWPADVLEKRRVEVGPFVWESQYQGFPTPEGGRLFRPEWFEHRYDRLPRYDCVKIIAIDTASKTATHNDFSVAAVLVTDFRDVYVEEVIRGKYEFGDLCRMVLAAHDRHRPHGVYIEDTSSGIPLIQMMRSSTGIPVIPCAALGSKETRASAMAPYFEAGRVKFPERAPWLDPLIAEFLSFPGGRHDDQVDALILGITALGEARERRQQSQAFRTFSTAR